VVTASLIRGVDRDKKGVWLADDLIAAQILTLALKSNRVD